jgi:hypothetical protein
MNAGLGLFGGAFLALIGGTMAYFQPQMRVVGIAIGLGGAVLFGYTLWKTRGATSE